MKAFCQMDNLGAWMLIIIGGFIGTVFTFGMHYWNAPIAPEDAQAVTAVYASYELDYGVNTSRKGRGGSNSLNQIYLHFADHERLSIDSACVDAQLMSSLSTLQAGTTVDLLVHPNSDNVLSMHADSTELLNFTAAVDALSSEATGFLFLGLLMYLGAAIGAYYLITGKTY